MTDMREAAIEAGIQAAYADWPLKAISPALAEMYGVEIGTPLTIEQVESKGGDINGMRRTATAAVMGALSLMQPEIDRRVADERAKLLERLREPSEEMLSCVAEAFYEASNMTRWESKGRAAQAFEFALAQFEKENSHEQG